MAAVQYNALSTFDLGDDDVFFGLPLHPAYDHAGPMERDASMANWTSTGLQVIDLKKMKDTGVEQAQPAEEDANGGEDSGHSTDGSANEGNEDNEGNDFNYYEFVNEDDGFLAQFTEDGTDQAGQPPMGIEILSNPDEVTPRPVFPSLPEDMDIDSDSFFAPSPPQEVEDEDGASTISTTGPDTIMTMELDDWTTTPLPKLGWDTPRHAPDQAIQPEPEVAEQEDWDERSAYSPLVEASGVDRNSLEPNYTAANANLGQDEIREMHNSGHFDIFADDDDSDVSSPPDSEVEDPDERLVPAGASESTNTQDWTIRFAGDLRRWQPPRTSRRTGSTSEITGSKIFKTALPSHKGHRSKSRRDREISVMTADVTTVDVDVNQPGSTRVPGCTSCSDYFAGGSQLKKDKAVSCCQKSSDYTNLLSEILDGTKTVPWNSEGKYNCGTENERCRTCKTRRVKCWISRRTVDASSTGVKATEDSG
jgi:hypothetical protein